eukprot:gnl/Spiro4/12920_TR6848_c0_g1_i1.p1 gnl/Spiro4/12920_TR6848_c0_g1~~gnl/Spiro4/12920_TR6848_c0_g1_i1.p1  ORF type:complete len:199 (+),score=33.17 gnl/Spiro4/12920_TR6848_c0_g1_i1:39-599(+)
MSHFLVIGDGDFSYSACLAEQGNCQVTATVLEPTAESVQALYPATAPTNLARLAAAHAQVLFGVDVCCLAGDERFGSCSVDVAVWNYPCGNEQPLSEILRRFFAQVRPKLKPSSGIARILFSASQVHYHSTELQDVSSEEGYVLLRSKPFDSSLFPSYVPSSCEGGSLSLEGATEFEFGIEHSTST